MENRIIFSYKHVLANWSTIESVEITKIDAGEYQWNICVYFKSGRQTVLEAFEDKVDAIKMLVEIRKWILDAENSLLDEAKHG